LTRGGRGELGGRVGDGDGCRRSSGLDGVLSDLRHRFGAREHRPWRKTNGGGEGRGGQSLYWVCIVISVVDTWVPSDSSSRVYASQAVPS